MTKSNTLRALLASAAVFAVSESALASEWGSFDGVTVEAKLIGGQQYEGLYGRIADWEAATGAKVEIISKKSHFEIDKEIKSDMAAGNVGVAVQPMGSVTNDCANKEAAVSLVTFLTSEESQLAESSGGSLPTRSAVWKANVAEAQAGDDPFRAESLAAFAKGAEFAIAVPAIPEWGETTNIVYPEL